MNKKKILFFAPSLSIGGAERVLVNLLKKFDYDKFDVTLGLVSYTGVYFEEIPCQVKIVGISKNQFIIRALIYLKRKFGIKRLLKYLTKRTFKESYDVGISFSDGQTTDLMLFLSEKFKRKISWVHSCYLSQQDLSKVYTSSRIKKLKKQRYELLDNIICVSQQSMIEFEKIFGQKEKLRCIHNLFGLEDVIKKANEPLKEIFDRDEVNIVAIGRLVKVKEYLKLIDATKILYNKGIKFRLRIVGGGKLKETLLKHITNNKIECFVQLTGLKTNPYPYLKNSDILVLTSSSEAFPTVLIEAMALGIPIVATKCSGCIEISDNGTAALLCDHTVSDIADKLGTLIMNKQIRDLYSKRGFKRLKFYNEQKTLENIYKILN